MTLWTLLHIAAVAAGTAPLRFATSPPVARLGAHRCAAMRRARGAATPPTAVCATFGDAAVVRELAHEAVAHGELPFALDGAVEAFALHPIAADFVPSDSYSASRNGALALEVVVRRCSRGDGDGRAPLSRRAEADVCRALLHASPAAHAAFCIDGAIRTLARAAFALHPLLVARDGVVLRTGGFGDGRRRWRRAAAAAGAPQLHVLRAVAHVVATAPSPPSPHAGTSGAGWSRLLDRRALSELSEDARLRRAPRAAPAEGGARVRVAAFASTLIRRAACASGGAASEKSRAAPPHTCVDLASLRVAATDAPGAAALPPSRRAARDATPCAPSVRLRRTLSGVGFHRASHLSVALDGAAPGAVVGVAVLQSMPGGAFFDVDEIDEVLRFAAPPPSRGAGAGGGDAQGGDAAAPAPAPARARARGFIVAGLRRAPLLAAHGWSGALRFGVDVEAPAHRARYHALALVLDARGGLGSGGAALALPALPFHLRYQKARAAGASGGSRATRLPPPRALIGSRCTAARGPGGEERHARPDDAPPGFADELRELLRGASDAPPADGAASPVDGGICWRLVRDSCRAVER